MTVKITKPELNLREKISKLDKPSGVAGEAMLRAETPQEQFNLIGAGRRNLLINGGFDVWQRGTTLDTTDYSADRWMQWMTNSGVSNRNVNCTKQTGGPIGKNSSYITYAPAVVDTGMEKFAWGQKIEKVNLDHIESGQSLTLSFWIKREQSLPVDNDMDIQILYPDSTDGWSAGYLFRNDENIDQTLDSISFIRLSTEWTKYSYTFIPSDTALDRGLAVYWHVGDTNFNLNNTNALISFTGVQLEVGKVATPFEHRSYGEELALCQRYFERLEDLASTDSNGAASTETLIGIGYCYTTTRVMGHVTWKATKRVNPTCKVNPVTDIQCLSSAGSWISATGVDVRANKSSARLDITTGSAMPAAGQACEIRFDTASPVGYIYIDAEL